MGVHQSEALLRLLDLASALAEERGAAAVTVDDVCAAADLLAAGEAPLDVPWARLRQERAVIWALAEGAADTIAEGAPRLEPAHVLARLGVDPATAGEAARRLTAQVEERPPAGPAVREVIVSPPPPGMTG